MSLTRAQLNAFITETIDVMCTAEAVCRTRGPCGNPQNGFDATTLLAALQAAYPASAWTAPLVTTVTTYMRTRGIIVTDSTGLLYLNYYMQRLGGENRTWAELCALVEQPVHCVTAQEGKGVDYTPIACATANPANGCCPPIVP